MAFGESSFDGFLHLEFGCHFAFAHTPPIIDWFFIDFSQLRFHGKCFRLLFLAAEKWNRMKWKMHQRNSIVAAVIIEQPSWATDFSCDWSDDWGSGARLCSKHDNEFVAESLLTASISRWSLRLSLTSAKNKIKSCAINLLLLTIRCGEHVSFTATPSRRSLHASVSNSKIRWSHGMYERMDFSINGFRFRSCASARAHAGHVYFDRTRQSKRHRQQKIGRPCDWRDNEPNAQSLVVGTRFCQWHWIAIVVPHTTQYTRWLPLALSA